MCRAGEAVFQASRRYWPDTQRIVVVCGGGNNAGDGYVIARLLRTAGLAIRVLTLKEPETLTGDALTAYQKARQSGYHHTAV